MEKDREKVHSNDPAEQLDPKSAHFGNLQNFPIFSLCSSAELVRLLPHIVEKTLEPNQSVFKSGEKPNLVYYILSGKIAIMAGNKKIEEIQSGYFGEEATVNAEQYLGDAIALEPTKVWAIPGERILAQLGKNLAVTRGFYSSLLSHYAGSEKKLFGEEKPAVAEKFHQPVSKTELIGWILSLLLPVLTWKITGSYNVEIKARLFMMVFSCITIMWIFRLMAEFIPCILGVLALIILGVAPAGQVLQGFSSGEFFLAMSIFGVGAVLVSSGLTYRMVLFILRYIPNSPFFHSLSMIIAGLLLTPVLPSTNGRVGLASPILIDMLEALEYKKKGKAATGITIGMFTGFTFFSSIFLTSKPINFVIYGLLPKQVKEQFQWTGWFTASAVAGLVMLVLTLVFLAGYTRTQEKSPLSKSQIDSQIRMLGPLSNLEWIALIAVGIFIFGICISSIHKIDPPWVALAILILLLGLEALKSKDFHERVNWSFVLYLAGLIGLVKTMSIVGIDKMIAVHLEFVGPLMREGFGKFVVVLFLSIGAVRLIVPNNATIAMFCTILLPLAQVNGINPWVVGYMILNFSEGWYFPYQSTYYILFIKLTEKSGWCDQKAVFKFCLLTNFFRLAAIFASINYWKWMGII